MLEVCRLCLDNTDLLDIFKCKPKNIVRLVKCISLATGVEIHQNDNISKCICYTCVQITVMFYKYRQKALANHRTLKECTEKQLQFLPQLNEKNALKHDLLDILKTNVDIPSCVEKYEKPSTDEHNFQRPSAPLQNFSFKSNKSSEKAAFNKMSTIGKRIDNPINLNYSETKSTGNNDVINRKLLLSETSTASLLERIDEETVFSCGYCNRMFTSQRNLKLHQRVYRFCSVCNGVFRNESALKRHQQEVCFKVMATNLPHVVVKRIDENLHSLEKLNPIIENKIDKPKYEILEELITYLEQESDKDSNSDPFLGVSFTRRDKKEKHDITMKMEQELEQSFRETLRQMNKELILKEEYESEHEAAGQAILENPEYELKPMEFKEIKLIFDKYKQPSRAHATTLTKPHMDICYSAKNRVILQKLGPLLKYCRIPINLRIGSTRLNCFGFGKKRSKRKPRVLYSWKGERVISTRKLKLNKIRED